jgi:hypothetical protein
MDALLSMSSIPSKQQHPNKNTERSYYSTLGMNVYYLRGVVLVSANEAHIVVPGSEAGAALAGLVEAPGVVPVIASAPPTARKQQVGCLSAYWATWRQ